MMSSELIKVTVNNDQQLVSARDLYKGLGLKGRFSRWVDNNFDIPKTKIFTSVHQVRLLETGLNEKLLTMP